MNFFFNARESQHSMCVYFYRYQEITNLYSIQAVPKIPTTLSMLYRSTNRKVWALQSFEVSVPHVVNKPNMCSTSSSLHYKRVHTVHLLRLFRDSYIGGAELQTHDPISAVVFQDFQSLRGHVIPSPGRVHSMCPAGFALRANFCLWFVHRCVENPQFLRQTVFTDQGRCLKLTQHVWDDENHDVQHAHTFQESFSINVWAGIVDGRLIWAFSLPRNLPPGHYLNY